MFRTYNGDTKIRGDFKPLFEQGNNYLTSIIQDFSYDVLDIPLRISDSMFYPHMLHSYHGIAHTARVLFASYLIVNMEVGVSDEIKKASYYAAIIHDLGKKSDGDGEYHGANSLALYEDFLDETIGCEETRQLVKDAIKFHSVGDCKCDNAVRSNIAWQILKDADALDRSRFGNGCNTSYLRRPIFRTPKGNIILYITKVLPRLTMQCVWENPYEEIRNAVIGLIKRG